MIDERLRHHLHADAELIELPAGDVGSIIGRASRRKRNRRAGLSAVMAIAVGTAGVTVFNGSNDQTVVAEQPGAVVESPYDWTEVEPRTGLGTVSATAATDDGAVYSLSTAPGQSYDDIRPASLYRSDDGAEWETVTLPDRFQAGSLAAGGGALYAVGTAPEGGGGGARVQVARTTDAGATWVVDEVPLGIEALRDRHPGQLVVGTAKVALGEHGPVGAVRVWAEPDVEARLPEGIDSEQTYSVYTADGVDVMSMEEMADDDGGGVFLPVASFTWDELDLDPELRAIASGGGRLYAFSLHSEGVQAVEIPFDGYIGDSMKMLADDAGYALVLQEEIGGGPEEEPVNRVRVLRSTDGQSWSSEELPGVDGFLTGAGVLDGRVAVAVQPRESAGITVHTADGLGGWRTADLLAATPAPSTGGDTGYVEDVAFGPLGVAAVVGRRDEPDGPVTSSYLVHSADGRTMSSVAMADHVGELPVGSNRSIGLAVTADAITVRLAPEQDDTGKALPGHRLLVGAPRG